MTVRLRDFRPSDLEEVLRLETAAFSDSPYSEETFRELYRMSSDLFLVAAGGAGCGLVGYALGLVGRRRFSRTSWGHVVSIAVDPSHRRLGVGRSMCDELFARIADAGATVIELEVRVGNLPAIRFWESLGFSATGRLRGYYGEREDALLMRKRVVGETR